MATVNFSTNLALALPTTGDLPGTWGTETNSSITNMLDEALGYQAFTATGGTDTLTIPNGTTGVARSIYIQLNGTGGGTVNVPTTKTKMYFVFNNTASAITFKVTGQTGVSIPASAKISLVSNGTDVIPAINYFSTAITSAELTGSVIPFYFGSTLPTAGQANHGAVAHLHSTGKLYYSHGSAWQIITSGLGTASTTGAVTPVGSAGQLLTNDGAGGLTSNTTGTGVVTALGVSTGTAGAFVVNGGALGTPSSGTLTLATGLPLTSGVTGLLPVANGGTATATPALVQGTGVTITGTWPNQTINATGTGGTVTSVGGTGTVNGISLSGTVTTSGNLTLGGTLSNVSLTTQVTGTLPVANGGTGITSFGAGVATFLGTPSSANLASAVTDETGTGALVFATSPTLVTPLLGTPTSGVLSGCTVDGTDAVGFRNIPQNSQSAAYTLVLADAGKHIFHPVGDNNARTFTIPANSSVAYPIGTAITFINMAAANVTIAITTDTMYLSSAGTTGSRTLAQYGSATAIKITSTNWLISGSGLT